MIYAAAQDAGGGNAVLPVLKALKERGLELKVWADGPAWSILSQAGLNLRQITAAEAHRGLSKEFETLSPALVLVGNSNGPSLEDVFVAEARGRGIPSVGLLDSWLHYDRKFSSGTDPWAFLPDTLIVMDEHAKAEMVGLGAPAERLLPLGQPQFDRLEDHARSFTPRRRRAVRALLGAFETGRLVLFLSQDMTNFFGGADKAREILGYTEYDVFHLLEKALSELSSNRREPISLAVKLHPREEKHKYRDRDHKERVNVVSEGDPCDMMMSADLVVGMDTILLVEAGLLGCPALSLQPHRRGTDTLITNRLGLGRFCYEPAKLPVQLEELLYDDKAREAAVASMKQFPVKPGATQRAADWISSRLKEKVA